MSKYPDELIEKVARGIFTGILYGGSDEAWDNELQDGGVFPLTYDRNWFRCGAQDILDALGLREEQLTGRETTSGYDQTPLVRYVTDWEAQ